MRNAFLLSLVLLFTCQLTNGQNNGLDSLRAVVIQASPDTSKVNLLLDIAYAFGRINTDSMYDYGVRAKELSQQLGFKSGETRSFLAIGDCQRRSGDFVNGLENCERALELAEQNNMLVVQTLALNNIGLIYNYQGDYPTALSIYQRALKIAESLNRKRSIASIYNNMGGIYYNLDDFDGALDFWKKTLGIHIELDHASAPMSMNNIGLAYAKKGDIDKSIEYYYQSISAYEDTKNCGRIYPLENIGDSYRQLKEYDSASYYLERALEGARECKDRVVQIGCLLGLAATEREIEQEQKALEYLESALEIAVDAGLKREKGMVLEQLSSLHEALGNESKAFEYFKGYHAISDSLYNESNAREIGRLEAKHEFEKNQKEKEVEQQITALQSERQLSREKWIRNTFVVGFVLMLIIAWLLYRNFKRKRRANEELRALNNEIDENRKELVEQAAELHALNSQLNELNNNLEAKIEERTNELKNKNKELEAKNLKLAEYAFINAHKLRAPVATLLGLIDLFENKSVNDTERAEIVNKIKHSTNDLNEVVHQIQVVLEEEGLDGDERASNPQVDN